MAHVALTGARGFVGWHTRVAALAAGIDTEPIAVGVEFDASTAAASVAGSSRLLHIAGVNRASDDEVRDGNIQFATQLAAALRSAADPPPVVVFANSTQVGNGSVYGAAKEEAASILAAAAVDVGADFVDLHFPNLFGEYGRPFYNSVVSTFCHLVATGGAPTIDIDRELSLLHAQDGADLLLGSTTFADVPEVRSTVAELLADIQRAATEVVSGSLPAPASAYERNLVNTYRSYVVPRYQLVAAPLGGGTECPAGIWVNRRTIERVASARGTATIALSRPFTTEAVSLTLGDGQAVDLPTLWQVQTDVPLRSWHLAEER